MATLNPATWHGLAHLGAIAPGYQADLLLLPDLERFVPELVLKAGRPVEEIPRPSCLTGSSTVRVPPVGSNDFHVPWAGGPARVIGLVPGQIVTDALVEELTVENGFAVADPARDLAKVAVVERHHGTGRIGLGFVRGFGLERGAFRVDRRPRRAQHRGRRGRRRRHRKGRPAARGARRRARGRRESRRAGRAAAARGRAPVGSPAAEVADQSRACVAALADLGCRVEAPFQALAFLALSVIPSLKLTDQGLVDVDEFRLVPLAAD